MPAARRAFEAMAEIESKGDNWGLMLEAAAARYPDHTAIKSEEARWTWGEYNERVNRLAHFFLSQGLERGDTAVVFVENRPDLLAVYSAFGKIGAVNSMINTNLRLDSLRHCMTLNPGRVFVIGEEVLDAFEEIREDLGLSGDQKLYYLPDRGEKPAPPGFIDLSRAVDSFPAANPEVTSQVNPRDALAYVFTSGTTGGLPKAAVVTHWRVARGSLYTGRIVLNMKPRDTMYVPLPFFHTNALALSWPTVFRSGAALAIRRKFSASRFWDDVRRYEATAFCYVGELCRYLMNQPPRPDDRDNPLEKIIGNGLRPDIWKAFKKRFGVSKVFEIYGAAESNLFFVNILNLDHTVGTSFNPFAIVRYDVDADEPVRDEKGFMRRVGVGESGLLLGRITEATPFRGYTSREATESKILRNVFDEGDAWFNSGDMIRDLGFNHIQFVDRLGDTFRWKGENVSTTEVEKVANTFPQIALSAVYGVLMPGGEGRVGMAAVVPETGGRDFDLQGLAEHFHRYLPNYAVPRFIRFQSEFEYTPTHKIKKLRLKNQGFDPSLVAEPLFVLLPGEAEFKPLIQGLHKEILGGRFKF